MRFLLVPLAGLVFARVVGAQAVDIGDRLELFVDDHVIERMAGGVERRLHKPVPREVVLVTDAPWEGNTCAYYTIFRDGDRFRMYYRGSHYDEKIGKATHREVTCMAESRDGVHWTKPALGLFEFGDTKKNNIVWDGIGTHCFTPFKDSNPQAHPEARYKAIARGRPRGKKGLYAFKSPDGIRWSLMAPGPVITKGAFDSQNLAFWDPHAKLYREYHRTFHGGVRSIMTGASRDFLRWTTPVLLEYPRAPKEHLYTNAVRPYDRAPHILLGFPTRYLPRQGSRVEPTFMASRDGRVFRRWNEALIPEDAPEDRQGNRSNYMTWGLVRLPGNDREYSVYATEAYYTGPDSRVRRFTFRVDGFVSVSAGKERGELVTKSLTFRGNRLEINYVARKGGSVRVELQDTAGMPIAGYALSDSVLLRGNAIAQTVTWNGGAEVDALGGKSVRVRFVLQEADVYSFRFRTD